MEAHPVGQQQRVAHNAGAVPDAGNPLDAQINEIATQAIRIGAIVLMTAAVGVVASYGFFTGLAVFGTGMVVSHLIFSNAQSTFLDMNSQLSSAEKAELVAKANFWSSAIRASTTAGVGGALIYNGVASILDGTLWPVLLGIGKTGVGALAALIGIALAKQAEDFGNSPSSCIKRLTWLHDALKVEGRDLPEEFTSFVLEKHLSPIAVDELIAEVIEHRAANHFQLKDYFRFLCPIMSGTSMETFLQRFNLKDWGFLLSTLSDELLARYIGSAELLGKAEANIAAIEVKKDDKFNHAAWIQDDRPLVDNLKNKLEKIARRLNDLPDALQNEDLNPKLDNLKAHKARIEVLQQRIQQLIEANNAKLAEPE